MGARIERHRTGTSPLVGAWHPPLHHHCVWPLVAAIFALLLLVPVHAIAQSDRPLPPSQIRQLNLDLEFRHWRRSLSSETPKPERLDRLWANARSYGYNDAVPYAFAALETLEDEADAGAISPSAAPRHFEQIRALAPNLPYPHAREASFYLDSHPSRVAEWVDSTLTAAAMAWRWPPTRFALEGYGILALLIAIAAASLFVLTGQVARHLGVAAHDLARRLPDSMTRGQILAAFWLVAAAISVLLQSLLLGGLFVCLAASLTQNHLERGATLAACVFIASLPLVDAQLSHRAGFPGSRAETLLQAQYLRCDASCRKDLQASHAEQPSPVAIYSLALAELRTGEPALVGRALERLTSTDFQSEPLRAYATNLKGAALLAKGELRRAEEALEAAARAEPRFAAPWFNLMRVADMTGASKKADTFRKKATKRNVDLVQRTAASDRRDPASHLILAPLPTSVFVQMYRATDRDADTSLLQPIWKRIAGPYFPLWAALPIGLVAILLALAAGVLRSKGLASTPCPNCGLAREPDDSEKTGGNPNCLPCYRTFLGGAELGYRARVHYETLLGRHASLHSGLRRIFSVLMPGAGHAAAGHPWVGASIAVPFALGLLLIAQPAWLWRPPYALADASWLGARAIGSILVAIPALVAVWRAWTDIEPLQTPASDENGGSS